MRINLIIVFLVFQIICFGQTTLKKVYCLDTNFVYQNIYGYYEGCQKKVIDTSYFIKEELLNKYKWEIYYDQTLKTKQSDFYVVKDTLFITTFYRSGKHKAVEKFLNNSKRLYTTLWCENGQVIASNVFIDSVCRHMKTYYCNGNLKYQGNGYNGNMWGKETKWYENGKKQFEKNYTEFDEFLVKNNKLESKLISEKYWDENGNVSEPFPTDEVNINMFDMPVYVPPSQLNNSVPYYEIRGQVDYARSMSKFKELVYNTVRIEKKCNCKVGLTYILFYIEKDGTITDISVDSSIEKPIDEALVNAIRKIKKWTPAIKNGENVKVAVKIGFELEKMKN